MVWQVVPYDRDAHEAFVRSSWTRGARQPWHLLADQLRRPATACVVAHVDGDSDSLLGWAVVDTAADVLWWVYVRSLFGKLRLRGLGTRLILEAGAWPLGPEPLACAFWSPHAAEIAAQGAWSIVYRPDGSRKAA